jgi:hypothetical protein
MSSGWNIYLSIMEVNENRSDKGVFGEIPNIPIRCAAFSSVCILGKREKPTPGKVLSGEMV